jgi:hypothetical protein
VPSQRPPRMPGANRALPPPLSATTIIGFLCKLVRNNGTPPRRGNHMVFHSRITGVRIFGKTIENQHV